MAHAGEVPVGAAMFALAGVALGVQAGINSSFGGSTSKPFAGVASVTVGTVCCVLYFLLDATAISKQVPSAAAIAGVPWWQWLGGILGAFHVLVNIAFALRLGSGTSVAVFVCVQLSTSIVLDLVGVVGFTKRAFSWPRVVGAVLMIGGVLLVTQFPGQPVTNAAKQQQQQQQQQLDGQALPAQQASPPPAPLPPQPPAAAGAQDGSSSWSFSGVSAGSGSSQRALLSGPAWGRSSSAASFGAPDAALAGAQQQQPQQRAGGLGAWLFGGRRAPRQQQPRRRPQPGSSHAVVEVL